MTEPMSGRIESIKGWQFPGKYVLASHCDADGIFSAALLGSFNELTEVRFPTTFGEVSNEDLVADMKPINPEYSGLVFDHHLPHPENKKYSLIWDECPTSLIIWKTFKDDIPPDLSWKVVGGVVGDGQPELIPAELWSQHPVLLEQRVSLYESYGDLKLYPTPVYMLLSSYVNAGARVGNPYPTYQIVKACKSPWDILKSDMLIKSKEILDRECDKLIKETHEYSTIVEFEQAVIWTISSKFIVEPILAFRLAEKAKKTVVVINSESMKMSVRGPQALWLAQRLPDFNIGGHPGFCGGDLKKDQTVESFIDAVRKLK